MGGRAKMLRTASTKVQPMHSKKPTKPKHLKALQWALDNDVYPKTMVMGAMGGGMFGFVMGPNRQDIFFNTVVFATIGVVGAVFLPVVVPVMIVGVPARATYWYCKANMPSQPKNE